ncbi:hypothetical protein GE09DRAFT_43987 [Coniochaeta sp. 2T2.1]|nr:hypothetical protein GE09DRAFT_43987 [Coniochaeta sp. 2T2.1]
MATVMTPFKRTSHIRESTIFDVLDDSDDGTTNSVCSPIQVDTPEPNPALGEVTANTVNDPAAEDLALQLDNFHIVTPAKINKTRGLKPRPTLDQSIFGRPAEEQENTKALFEGGRGSPSDTTTARDETEDNFVKSLLALRNSDSIPSDSTQLAKHRAGEFEYVLSLPAVDDTVVHATTNDTSSAKAQKAKQETTTVQFGCNIVRADGSSELPRRDRSSSGNTYSLIVTPIEGDEKTAAPRTAKQVADKIEDMATATVVEVTQPADLPAESLQLLGEPPKAPAVAEVAEVPAVSSVTDEPEISSDKDIPSLVAMSETEDDRRMPGLATITSPRFSSGRDNQLEHNANEGSRWSSDVSASRPASRHDAQHSQQIAALRKRTSRGASEALTDESSDFIDEIISLTPAPGPDSRIEDSVEALDKLEEHLDAMDEATQLERELSVEPAKAPVASTKKATVAKRTQPAAAKPATKATLGSATRAATVGRSASVRHSMAPPPSKQSEHTAAARASASKRLSVVSRPASLAPPRPLVRSSKPPTTSTFELPGEAVAQRLKEKRLARLSMSMPPSSTQTPGRTASPTKPRTVTSSKPPTRPNFELPGEAISRRKREEHEAKLKAEAEEERKRREFKARPVRTSIVQGGTFPRQTAASRARMGLKTTMAADTPDTTTSTSTTAATPSAGNKRHSTIGHGMSSRPSLAVSTTAASRGRVSVAPSPSTAGPGTRATSTSTGSVRASSVSAEEAQQQKLKGKEIFKRESSFVSEKERERRSREEAARKAREEAAERSRQQSREWAEKQKMKRASVAAKSAGAQ